MDLYAGLILGLLGSLHCAGMCGPIAIAVPLSRESWFSRIAGGLLYNSGRTLTYVILGAVFGLAGMGLAVGGLQQVTSIAAGAVMILSIIIPSLGMVSSRVSRISDPLTQKIKSAFSILFRRKSMGALFTLGMLNGILPCGLVYIALAGALVMSHVYEGALYMLLFGIGTIPMMLAISLAGHMISLKMRRKLSRVVPYFIVLLGVLFILRGLNLGIPYVSPKLAQHGEEKVMECCEPKN